MPASCRFVHQARSRAQIGEGRAGLPAAARTSSHSDACKNASVILNLS